MGDIIASGEWARKSGKFLSSSLDDIVIQLPGATNEREPVMDKLLLGKLKEDLASVLVVVKKLHDYYAKQRIKVNFILTDVTYLKRKDVAFNGPLKSSEMELLKIWHDHATSEISR